MSSNRITRSFLRARVDRLNKMLNRPATAWTRTTKAHDWNTKGQLVRCSCCLKTPKEVQDAEKCSVNMVANVGHFLLDTSNPGDGWTRYKLCVIGSVGGGEHIVSPTCTAQEMSVYIQGVFDVLDSLEYTKHFAKYPVSAETEKAGA